MGELLQPHVQVVLVDAINSPCLELNAGLPHSAFKLLPWGDFC